MAEKIFGYDFSDIQRAQQGGRLSRRIDLSKPASSPQPTAEDIRLLNEFGSVDALRAAGFHGTAYRLAEAAQ